jgi:hypothetical protein
MAALVLNDNPVNLRGIPLKFGVLVTSEPAEQKMRIVEYLEMFGSAESVTVALDTPTSNP